MNVYKMSDTYKCSINDILIVVMCAALCTHVWIRKALFLDSYFVCFYSVPKLPSYGHCISQDQFGEVQSREVQAWYVTCLKSQSSMPFLQVAMILMAQNGSRQQDAGRIQNASLSYIRVLLRLHRPSLAGRCGNVVINWCIATLSKTGVLLLRRKGGLDFMLGIFWSLPLCHHFTTIEFNY